MSTRNGIGTIVRWGLLRPGFVVAVAGMAGPAVAADVFSACSKNTTNKVADEQHRGQRDRRLQVHGHDAYVARGGTAGAAGTLRRLDPLWHEHKQGGGWQRTDVYAGRNHLERWLGGERRTGQWPASSDFSDHRALFPVGDPVRW